MCKSKLDLSQVREFGVRVLVHVLEVGKLEARAEDAVFVGMDAQSKGVRVYWPGKHRVSVERNITFPPMVPVDGMLDEGESNSVQPITMPQQPQPSTPEMRSTRVRPPPGYYVALNEGQTAALTMEDLALAAIQPEPTLQQALKGPDAQGVNIISCHYVLAMKRGPDGEKLKLHARLVANGQRQKYGVNFFETFALTANMSTIHAMLTMAICESAGGNLHESTPGISGLKQAGYEWVQGLAGASSEHVIITMSVNDMAITANHISYILHFKSELRQHFEISDLNTITESLCQHDRRKVPPGRPQSPPHAHGTRHCPLCGPISCNARQSPSYA